ncbi:hypothetical protein F5X68DRAFT_176351 [Plectosphaerella plurivora]|uniref:Integral membrane protein n=1 Tax=Plectosphaerella plurivora TaxID=936078 RepID=A0A9P8V320_9PEZI|nr:hypothetical protein F5X68DRAFT_176351 [Plectosphaerella plurivora]
MRSLFQPAAALAVLVLLPTVLGHGDEHGHNAAVGPEMAEGYGNAVPDAPKPDDTSAPDTYFALADHAGLMYAHIALMVLAWIFVLPVAVMLSIARSRYTLALQFLFMATNSVGLLLAVIYNASTPDLYPNNAHHKLGWILTVILGVQLAISVLGRVAGTFRKQHADVSHENGEYQAFLASSASVAQNRLRRSGFSDTCRLSNDSGQGTEPNTESLRSTSISSASPRLSKEYADHDDDDLEDGPVMPMPAETKLSLLRRFSEKIPARVFKGLMLAYNTIDRIILILGFVVLCLGIVAYGRFFEGQAIFSGLAHWVKGGIFVWLGILTLGRWSGSFGEIGWAWNLRPKRTDGKWHPSAEFVESFLIFVYGSTNIFMEHMGNVDGKWTAQDLEHLSITVLFLGGGLLGMLIESIRVRDLLNTTVSNASTHDEEHSPTLEPPRQYDFSINPIPALVILLLGIMMSSHTQPTMISSMIHKQWGNLLTAASFARGLTYVLLYLKPPRSVYPSRPPTELLASFGLIAGGIIFMASAGDTVQGMIHYELDAMFMYTVTMGLVGLLMAWIIVVLCIKGWAVRREAVREA